MLVRKGIELLESPADVVELFVVIADILPGDSIWKVVAPALDKDVSLVVVNLLSKEAQLIHLIDMNANELLMRLDFGSPCLMKLCRHMRACFFDHRHHRHQHFAFDYSPDGVDLVP